MDKFRIDGRVAIVTGAAGLLGAEHCKAILEVGGNVALIDINPKGLEALSVDLKQLYPDQKVLAIQTDITSELSVKGALEATLKDLGSVDILINNAAMNPNVQGESVKNSGRIEDFSISDWEKQISVGLTGAFICSKIFGSHMAKVGKGGVIINIGSDLSVIAPDQRLYAEIGKSREEQSVKPVTYSVVKSGLIGLTRYLSTYWIDKGIRCNALSPGGVYVDQSENFVRKISSLIPMGRMANIDEYRSTMQYLCSDASSYLNGQNIIVDGGRTVW